MEVHTSSLLSLLLPFVVKYDFSVYSHILIGKILFLPFTSWPLLYFNHSKWVMDADNINFANKKCDIRSVTNGQLIYNYKPSRHVKWVTHLFMYKTVYSMISEHWPTTRYWHPSEQQDLHLSVNKAQKRRAPQVRMGCRSSCLRMCKAQDRAPAAQTVTNYLSINHLLSKTLDIITRNTSIPSNTAEFWGETHLLSGFEQHLGGSQACKFSSISNHDLLLIRI